MGSLYLRGGVYQGQVVLPDGRKVQRSLGTSSKREAKAELLRLEEKLLGKGDVAYVRTNADLESLYKKYKEWAECGDIGRSRNTVLGIRFALESWKRFGFPISLNRISPSTVAEFQTALAADGKSPRTINKYPLDLRGLMVRATKEGWYKGTNPFERFERVRDPKKAVRFLSREQLNSLLQAAETVSAESHIVIALGSLAGMRKAEITHAKWGWIDFDHNLVRIQSEKEPGGWKIKDRDERVLPLKDELRGILERYRPASAREDQYILRPEVIQGVYDYRVDIRKPFRAACKGAQVGEWTIHELRHTFASLLVIAGISVYKVSRWLGHSSVQLTQDRYAHLAPQDDQINAF